MLKKSVKEDQVFPYPTLSIILFKLWIRLKVMCRVRVVWEGEIILFLISVLSLPASLFFWPNSVPTLHTHFQKKLFLILKSVAEILFAHGEARLSPEVSEGQKLAPCSQKVLKYFLKSKKNQCCRLWLLSRMPSFSWVSLHFPSGLGLKLMHIILSSSF